MAMNMSTFAGLPATGGSTFQNLLPTQMALATQGPLAQQDSVAFMDDYLRSLGLSDLDTWAEQMITTGASPSMVQIQLWEQPAFKKRFAGMFQYMQRFPNMTPPSPAEVISWEQNAVGIMRAAGFPQGFYDSPEDLQDMIGKGVSIKELSDRAALYQQAAYQVPQEVRNELRDLYGVDEGHLASYYADPDRAQPLLERQFAAAQAGGASLRSGFGQLTTTEAERLASLGVTGQQATAGFGQLVASSELFRSLPGISGEGDISRQTQLEGVFGGSAAAQLEIERRQRQRQAVFEGGGGFAASQRGVTGLGAAQ